MGKKNRQNSILENIEILDIASEGKAITKHDGMIVFVKEAIPGDVVDLEIYKRKKNYAEGKVLKIRKYSEKRSEPFCSHFGTCGGCKWQNLKYEEQLFYKQKQVVDAFEHIGKIDLTSPTSALSIREGENHTLYTSPVRKVNSPIFTPFPTGKRIILPIIPSKNQTYYRNKLEFAFSNKRWLSIEEIKSLPFGENRGALGFHISGLFDKVLDIEHCYLQPLHSNEIRLELKKYATENKLTFYDFRKQEGFLRNLIIRNSSLGELMVIVIFCNENIAEQEKLLNHISITFPEITSLMYINNPKKNDTIYDLDIHLFKGRDFINEKLDDLIFKISPKSFFQTNTEQALELYKVVRDFAQIKNTDIVYDLYTGTGTIANYIARNAKKVIGIESIPDAIKDAKENSRVNNISNTEFFSGDIKDVLKDEFLISHGKPNVIITDPPRAGMDEKVIKKILEIEPERIVYVSCNPATQARDMALLGEKYELKIIQPVDMFPHTHHVENVAEMERKE